MGANRTIYSVKKSRYLSKHDCEPPLTVTIDKVAEELVDSTSGESEYKQVIYFKENVKPTILNWTNAKSISRLLGSDNFDDWPGGKITLFNDQSVEFRGEVGGIRARAADNGPQKSGPEFDDPIPQ